MVDKSVFFTFIYVLYFKPSAIITSVCLTIQEDISHLTLAFPALLLPLFVFPFFTNVFSRA